MSSLFVRLARIWARPAGSDPGADTPRVLTEHAERLRAAAEEAGPPHADLFWDMAGCIERIRNEVQADERDRAMVRGFARHHARLIVELSERFVELKAKSRVEHADRLEKLAGQLHEYYAVFGRVEKACIDNDFDDLDATMEALDIQLKRLAF